MRMIDCQNCGSVYELSYKRFPMRDKDIIYCEICGKELYSWNEGKIWSAKLVTKKLNHKNNP